MSGLDGCLRADVTWVGSGEKEIESFHVCFSAAQCWQGTGAEQGPAWSASAQYIRWLSIRMTLIENTPKTAYESNIFPHTLQARLHTT